MGNEVICVEHRRYIHFFACFLFLNTLILQIYTNESGGLCCWRFKRTRIMRIYTNETEDSAAGGNW